MDDWKVCNDKITDWQANCGMFCRRSLVQLVQGFLAQPCADAIKELTKDWPQAKSRPYLELSSPEQAVSVWLLGWRKGDMTEVHDHTMSEAGVYVVSGELFEHVYAPAEEVIPNKPFRCHRMDRETHPGSTITIGKPYIHKMGNKEDDFGLSIHAYLPKLEKMILYQELESPDNNGQCRIVTSGEWVAATER